MTTGQDQILSALRTTLAVHRGSEGHVCVGLSGGLDSVVLLHALAQLRDEAPFHLSALHVHHGLSPNADHWAAFCRSLCEDLGIPCDVIRLELPDSSGKGLERVAREARYEAFAAAPGDILCLAHHQNDRAETLLLNLFRGSGATGLVGVPNVRQLGQKTLVRPFFEISRAALVAWATARQLCWIEDESNQNLAFRRNYVRHRILPAIAEMYPGVVSVLARTSAQMSEQAALLNRLAEHDAQVCRDQQGYLSVSRLQQLPEAAVRNILRYRFAGVGIQLPAARRLREFSAQLMMAQSDSEAFVRMGSIGVHLWRDRIWIDPAMDSVLPEAQEVKSGLIVWPDGTLETGGSARSVPDLKVAPVGHGQRFHPKGRCRDRVSELLRAQGVAPWVRARLPGLWRHDALLWVPYLGWAEQTEGVPELSSLDLRWQPETTLPL